MLKHVANNRVFIIIFILALFLRIYRLSELPIGFHADEVRVAWNSFSILHTGSDDRGNIGALYYNTFGDFRPTGIFYITIPSIAILGLNIFATRFPAALIGALTVIPLYLFTLQLTKNKTASLFSSFFLGISPWHISPSRSTSEVVISLFFTLLSLVFIFKKKYLISFVLFFLSMLLYHSARIVIPLYLIAIFIQTRSQKVLFLFLAMSFVTIALSLNPAATARFNQVALTTDNQILGEHAEAIAIDTRKEDLLFHNRPGFFLKQFLDEYTQYFSTAFLTNENILPIRYATGGGLVSYTALLFILIGIIHSIKQKQYSLVFLLLFISIIPAALTKEDSPNIHRALFMLPFLAIFSGIGFFSIKKYKIVSTLLLIIFCIQIFSFWHMYRKHSPEIIATARNNGALEVINYLKSIDQNAEIVYLSNEPDDLYPWFAVYHKLDPKEFNPIAVTRAQGPWQYRNYHFTQDRCPSDKLLASSNSEKIIVVDRGEMCGVAQKLKDGIFGEVIQEIKHPDGTVAFTVWRGRGED